jgi:hypothetical protein
VEYTFGDGHNNNNPLEFVVHYNYDGYDNYYDSYDCENALENGFSSYNGGYGYNNGDQQPGICMYNDNGGYGNITGGSGYNSYYNSQWLPIVEVKGFASEEICNQFIEFLAKTEAGGYYYYGYGYCDWDSGDTYTFHF